MTKEELLQQPDDAYMNDQQQAYFHALLCQQRSALQDHMNEAFERLRSYESSSDTADIACTEEQRQSHLRFLEREKKLLDKIDQALQRLARGDYGWCDETGEPIGLLRLLSRPTATLCTEAKERQENFEKHLRHR